MKEKIKTSLAQNREIISYVIVGGLTTLVSLGSFWLASNTILDPLDPVELQLANILSWVLAVAFAYITNRIFVFQSKNANKLAEAASFVFSRVGTLLIDMLCMHLFVQSLGFDSNISKLIVQAIILVANYALSKFFVFSNDDMSPIEKLKSLPKEMTAARIKIKKGCRHFYRKNKYWIKLTAISFLILLVGASAIFAAHFSYIDDQGRVANGVQGFTAKFSRYVSSIGSAVIHNGTLLSDISPLPQIFALAIIAVSGILIVYLLPGKKKKRASYVLIPVLLAFSPFFIECLSYKFDSPYMALSVLFSILPLLFAKKSTALYLAATTTSAVLVCTSYQSSLGIFPILVIFLGVLKWAEGEETKDVLAFIFKSAIGFIAGVLIFRIFLMTPTVEDSYVASEPVTLHSILKNYRIFYGRVWHGANPYWKILGAAILVIFTFMVAKRSQHNKILTGFYALVAFGSSMVLALSFMPLLSTIVASPRYLIAINTAFPIMAAAIIQHTKAWTPKAPIALLSYSLIVFAFTYGNALIVQEKYDLFREQAILRDINELNIEIKEDEERYYYLSGIIASRSPLLEVPVEKYPIIDSLVPETFSNNGDWSWSHARLEYNYYNLPTLGQWKDLKDEDLPLVKETTLYNIYAKDNLINIELKQ